MKKIIFFNNNQDDVSSKTYLRRINSFGKFVLISLMLAIFYHSIMGFLNFQYPWNTFLFDPNDRFNDWNNSVKQSHSSNPYYSNGPALATYFPFSYVFFSLLGFDGKFGILVYFLFTFVLLIILSFCMINNYHLIKLFPTLNIRVKLIALLLIFTLFTYPVIFSLDRGNIDFWIALMSAIFVFSIWSRFEYVGIFALAIAISLKGYPGAFSLLLLLEKKFFKFFQLFFIVLVLTIAPVCFLWGSVDENLRGFIINLQKYKEVYVIGNGSLFASSDPYNAIRLIVYEFADVLGNLSSSSEKQISQLIYGLYEWIISALAVIIFVYVIFVNDQKYRKIFALSLLAILFPGVANDYKLCMLLPALFFLIFEIEYEIEAKKFFILTSLLLIPKSYLFIHGKSISMLLNPSILICLILLILNNKSVKLQFKNHLKLIKYQFVKKK